jgi:four helix bundle protein
MEGYEKLIVWRKSMQLVREVYNLTRNFPKSETFGLTSQMNRAAVSIPSNIAEGYRRGSKKEFTHFLRNSYGSGAELETQV